MDTAHTATTPGSEVMEGANWANRGGFAPAPMQDTDSQWTQANILTPTSTQILNQREWTTTWLSTAVKQKRVNQRATRVYCRQSILRLQQQWQHSRDTQHLHCTPIHSGQWKAGDQNVGLSLSMAPTAYTQTLRQLTCRNCIWLST